MPSAFRSDASLARFFTLFCLLLAFAPSSGLGASTTEAGLADSFEQRLRDPFDGDLEALLERGYVRVLVPFSKSFYFIDKGVQRGISVDVANEFRKYLLKTHGKAAKNVAVTLLPTSRDKLFQDLAENRGDIALGNLTVTADREKLAAFSAPLIKDVHEVPVTSGKVPDLTSPQDLSGKEIHIRKSSSYFESLEKLNESLSDDGKEPVKLVVADERLQDEDLLEMVAAGAIPMVVVDQHKATLWMEVLEGLKSHPKAAVRTDGEIAIAVRKSAPELLKLVNGYAATVKKGTLLGNILIKRYLKEAEYLKDLTAEDYESALQDVRNLFQKYGSEYKFDWLLIAAQSYQESKFDQKARNPTGAVGLMQIKPSTAQGNPINIDGVAQDPEKNVHAGVKYLRHLADQYFAGLSKEKADQMFFSLAAYNAGPSRFARMRKEAEDKGYDPDKWFGNVEWIVASRIGRQPVDYVGNIFQYYVVFENERKRRKDSAVAKDRKTATE
ncbi:transglycosylase SLT domain-containing protein [Roseibium aggregatum]|uniref:Transporter substrate-binding domain-containing protein n=1 Tax=Roseibium aggregatum TaxID=187304 RepID=A0A939EEL9_9HYPH|nr:transglycosylase SLT domain-containing protein [Roseibium aggregatum]MBN9671122.1 transporter substrate-binding domain-containing protein [Roseibium aggregatum]